MVFENHLMSFDGFGQVDINFGNHHHLGTGISDDGDEKWRVEKYFVFINYPLNSKLMTHEMRAEVQDQCYEKLVDRDTSNNTILNQIKYKFK